MTQTTQPNAHRPYEVPELGRRSAVANLGAQGAALGVVSLASLLVARASGAAVLGEYTLLRVLPWLMGVTLSCGLPVAAAYFLAGESRLDPRLRPTLCVLALGGAAAGAGLWLAVAPLLRGLFFTSMSERLVAVMAATVVTQLWTVWAKACCQGSADMRGANLVIVCEELLFLPAYGLALGLGLRGIGAVVAGMIGGGICAAATALGRLAWRRFFRDWGLPSRAIARSVIGFGARGQLGNLLWLVNLRLDFLVLGALAGPATLGVYAVASKFAELMRLPASAVNYVLYPRFARSGPAAAGIHARRLLPRAVILTVLAAPVLAAVSVVAVPLFGDAFRPAVLPACLLLVGLAVEGAAAVSSAYLCGTGRPGVNSWGMGLGVIVTVTLDVLLIPTHGAAGAAVASSIAYLVTTGVLTNLTWRLSGQVIDANTSRTEGAA